MIYDCLPRLAKYRPLSRNIAQGIDFIQTRDIHALADGRYDVTAGVYALVQTYPTKAEALARWETHRQYIDLQLMLEGQERIDIADVGALTGGPPFDEAKDVQFYTSASVFQSLTLRAGEFGIFHPHDGHRPAILTDAARTVRKLILKISVNDI